MTYQTRTICIIGQSQVDSVTSLVKHLPRDGSIEVVIREVVKKRKSDQNGMQWAGVLSDFEEQGWVQGKQYSQIVWHEFLKGQFLPDNPEDGITLKDYAKWVELPTGERRMVGSTTRLSVRGFAQYIEQVTAYGASELGIRFSVNPNEGRS